MTAKPLLTSDAPECTPGLTWHGPHTMASSVAGHARVRPSRVPAVLRSRVKSSRRARHLTGSPQVSHTECRDCSDLPAPAPSFSRSTLDTLNALHSPPTSPRRRQPIRSDCVAPPKAAVIVRPPGRRPLFTHHASRITHYTLHSLRRSDGFSCFPSELRPQQPVRPGYPRRLPPPTSSPSIIPPLLPMYRSTDVTL
jgi:hypothetical protein